jgi:hypothetical protein
MPISRNRIVWLGLTLWLATCAAGLGMMAAYANRPGVSADAPASWPAASRLVLDPVRPTLVMLAHPMCDCTRASLAELAEFIARSPGGSTAYVVFIEPPGSDAGWDDTALWKTARAIPGVTTVRDDGREMERFGAATSGQVLMYAPDGHLLFSGGATVARGHEGDNAGLQSMLAIVRHDRPSASQSPVFGCALSAARQQRGTREIAR